MAYFEDLSPCTYFEGLTGQLISIGWLAPGFDYETGDVSKEFFEALFNMLKKPWQPYAFAGREPCRLCKFTHGMPSLTYLGEKVSIGANNLFLPDGGKAFVAPSLVIHYIDSHGYKPPAEFQAAVLRESSTSPIEMYKKLESIGLAIGHIAR